LTLAPFVVRRRPATPPSDLIKRGLAHAARFSWDRTARETLCVYETLLERGSRLD
jgi:hypothetical protein